MSYRTLYKLMLPLTCAMFIACGDDSGSSPDEGSFSQSEYSEYVGSTKMLSDMENYLEFLLKTENLRMYYLVSTMNENYEFFTSSIDDKEFETFYKKIEEINIKNDEYETALQNIENSRILERETKGLMKIGLIASVFEWTMTLKSSGTKNRETLMNVMNSDKNLMAQRKDMFDDLPESLKKGETDYKTWWNNLNNGEYDNAAPQILKLFEQDMDFSVAEQDLNTNSYKLVHEIGQKAVEQAAEMELEILKEVADPIGTGADVVEYVNLSGEIAKAAKDGDPAKLTDKITETIKKATGLDDVEKASKLAGNITHIVETKVEILEKKLLGDDGKIEIEDADTSSSALIGIAVTESGKIVTSVGADENGKIGIYVPEGEKVKVTAIDWNGDKYTQTVNVTAGETTKVEVSTTESETLKNSSSSEKSCSSTASSSSAKSSSSIKGTSSETVNSSSSTKEEDHAIEYDPSKDWSKGSCTDKVVIDGGTVIYKDQTKLGIKNMYVFNNEGGYQTITIYPTAASAEKAYNAVKSATSTDAGTTTILDKENAAIRVSWFGDEGKSVEELYEDLMQECDDYALRESMY